MSDRLDTIDHRILFRLVQDARGTSAPDIADEVNVTSGTIRNRIGQLEAEGIIRGYHANVDYERTGGRLTNLFTCTSPVPERERHAKQAAEIPGVVHVRQLLAGRRNLHITAVADDMQGLTRVAHDISNLGPEIEEQDLIESDAFRPYEPFGPEQQEWRHSIADFMSLSGGAEVVELTVSADSDIAGRSLREAGEAGLIDASVLVVSVEREEEMLTPRGETRIRPDDLVTIFCRNGVTDRILNVFGSAAEADGAGEVVDDST